MKLIRTANAGVLLETDGKKILLDGVCREVSPYPATPDHLKKAILENPPDLVAVTHCHEDHCDPDFEDRYRWITGRQVLTPGTGDRICCDSVSVVSVPSRHIGKGDCDHVSYVIKGSKTILFTGDAAPSQWREGVLQPDVLICPFAYLSTPAGWRSTCRLSPKIIIVLHLPEREKDELGLRQAVEKTVRENPQIPIFIPEIGESISF